MVLNRYPWWKNLLVVVVAIVGFIFALPNLYGEDPAVQVSGATATAPVDDAVLNKVTQALQTAQIKVKEATVENRSLLVRFASTDVQLNAKEIIQQTLGADYLVALNLAPATPHWLKSLNAMPMKLGLDLRGGVHFLLQVDVDSVLQQRIDGDIHNISQTLREQHIRYSGLTHDNNNSITIQFKSQDAMDAAYHEMMQRYIEFTWTKTSTPNDFTLKGVLDPASLQRAHQDTLEQAMNTLRNRVNELGVSEAVVQQEGASRVAIDLPGIQNSTEAKNILGKTATLEFHMVDNDHDAGSAVGGIAPPDTHLYMYDGGRPVLLKNDIILRGSSITSASSAFGEDGRASVNVRLGGGGESLFTKTTAENIGKPMAVLYVEVKSEPKMENGQRVISYQTERKIISVATIQSALGNSFEITGLTSQEEARTLALLLRAGALKNVKLAQVWVSKTFTWVCYLLWLVSRWWLSSWRFITTSWA
jgi:preprotein translocase subunit SecD